MATDEDIWLLLLLGAFVLTRKQIDWGTGWVFPIPDLKTSDGRVYRGMVSDGWGTPRHLPGGGITEHRGADVMYRRASVNDRPEYKPGTHDGTRGYFAPRFTPVLAARDGKVWSVNKTPRGYAIVLDHGKPWATFYQHLESVFRVKGATVRAGDIIGVMGYDPLDPAQLRHLHFEAWHGGAEESAVDVAPQMDTWARSSYVWTPKP